MGRSEFKQQFFYCETYFQKNCITGIAESILNWQEGKGVVMWGGGWGYKCGALSCRGSGEIFKIIVSCIFCLKFGLGLGLGVGVGKAPSVSSAP